MYTEELTPYVLSWQEGVFPLGADTLALGAFATVRRRQKVCDIGTGSGALLLLLHRREPTLLLTGVEVESLAAQTAQFNLEQNHLEGEIRREDLRHCSLPVGSFDLVVSNPPYFALSSGISGGIARAEEMCTLKELCTCAGRLVKNGGRFALCYRPERLTDLMVELRRVHLEPKRMKLVSHSPEHKPFLVLMEAVKQGNAGLEILP